MTYSSNSACCKNQRSQNKLFHTKFFIFRIYITPPCPPALNPFINAYKKRGTELLFAFRGSGITVHNKQSKAHAERERLHLTLVVLEIFQISKDKCKVNAFYMFVPALFVR